MIGSLVFLAILVVIVSLVSLVRLIALGSLVDIGRQAILLSIAKIAILENIAIAPKLRSLPRKTRGVIVKSLTVRDSLGRLYRMTIHPGVGGPPRLGSMRGMRRDTRLTIMVITTRPIRLNNTTRKNRPPRAIRLTNHPDKEE